MFNKGDVVLFKSRVMFTYSGTNARLKNLISMPYAKERKGIILGYSFRRSGYIKGGNPDPFDYGPSYLSNIKDHKVWIIEPFEQNSAWYLESHKKTFKTNRYLKPVAVFEEDIIRTGE